MNVKKTLLIGAISGFIVGVIFIYVQPFFGMSPLTGRHAAAYTKFSDISPSMAIIIAWTAHLLVSVVYGIVTGIAFIISQKFSKLTSKMTSKNLLTFGLQIVVLGWCTTVIAGPANQLIVRIVTNKGFPSIDNLPPLNFNLDAKLALHLVFFLSIGLFIWSYNRFSNVDSIKQAG